MSNQITLFIFHVNTPLIQHEAFFENNRWTKYYTTIKSVGMSNDDDHILVFEVSGFSLLGGRVLSGFFLKFSTQVSASKSRP